MQMMSSLVVVLSVVLIGQTWLVSIVTGESGSLIEHPDPTEELSKQQLMDKLNELRWDDKSRPVPVSVFVADLLYRAKDKNSTEAIKNVTLAELIEQNNFRSLADCSKQAFGKRVDVWDKMPKRLNQEGATFGIEVYLLRCLHLATENCLEHGEQVVDQKINNGLWLAALMASNSLDGQTGGADEAKDEDIVHRGRPSYVANFIAQNH